MRALPNMTVLTPGDPREAGARPRARRSRIDGPVYLRLGKNGEPARAPGGPAASRSAARLAARRRRRDGRLRPARCCPRRSRPPTCSRRAASRRASLHFGTVKPLDADAIAAALRRIGAGRHASRSTRSSAASAAPSPRSLAESGCAASLRRIGMPDASPTRSARAKHLMRHYGMDAEAVARRSTRLLGVAPPGGTENGRRAARDRDPRRGVHRTFAFMKAAATVEETFVRGAAAAAAAAHLAAGLPSCTPTTPS